VLWYFGELREGANQGKGEGLLVEKTEQESELLARALREHQAHPHDDMSQTELRLHLALHAVVEQQLEHNDPPGLRPHLERLIAAGLTRHQAVHAIASVAGRELGETLEADGAYDEARYLGRLGELNPDDWR
jgi:hypothetical protein